MYNRLSSQAKSRLPWVAAFGALFFIWSLWSLGLRLNVFPTGTDAQPEPDHPMVHLGSPTEANNNVALQTPPKFAPFDSFIGHENDTDYVTDRPLILYAFFETEPARRNLVFYLEHALHNSADFLFIFNGKTDADKLLPKAGNIRFIRRKNDCYDLGAFAEVLTTNDFYKKYNKYITMNASIRGPFIPYWAKDCWSERYLSKVTNETKLVGMTMNCRPRVHIQSMIWATDRIGMEILLYPSYALVEKYQEELAGKDTAPVPSMKHAGMNSCPHEYWDAVAIEVYATGLLQTAGYKVDSMMLAYHSSKHYETECLGGQNLQGHGMYYGMDFHPYDTFFLKTNRNIDPLVIDRFTGWTDQWGYTSYEACDAK